MLASTRRAQGICWKSAYACIGQRLGEKMAGMARTFIWTLMALSAASVAKADTEIHVVIASSFADPADVAAYKKCLTSGKTAKQCLAIGDNGIGLWGDDTTVAKPICALAPDDWLTKWKKGSVARGKKIELSLGDKKVICELRDTMPAKANITNGAGIDLNPGAAVALGLKPPFMKPNVGWRWVD
jgi:hypothetical protein